MEESLIKDLKTRSTDAAPCRQAPGLGRNTPLENCSAVAWTTPLLQVRVSADLSLVLTGPLNGPNGRSTVGRSVSFKFQQRSNQARRHSPLPTHP